MLLADFMPALSHLLTAHNVEHPEDAPRMRAAMHAGEVLFDNKGCFGESVDLSCRLLDAPELKRRLAGIDTDAFELLVRVQLGTAPHRGWVTVPGDEIPRQRTGER